MQIVCPDPALAARTEEALAEFKNQVTLCPTVQYYPSVDEMKSILRTHGPEAVLISFEELRPAQDLTRMVEAEVDGIQIIALNKECDTAFLRETMRLGIREVMHAPFEHAAIAESLGNVREALERKKPAYKATAQIFSFLPSKAGVGTTTLALNTCAALARHKDKRVLLLDFDLNSGMLRFLMKLKSEHSILDALELSASIDDNMWPQMVTSIGNLDVLHAGRVNPNVRVDRVPLRTLIQFWTRNYDVICFDLSGNLERYSLDLMQESKRVFLVCTPEIPSLHLTREKMAFLKTLELDGRIAPILNRVPKDPLLPVKQVEEVIGVPLLRSFINDYHAVSKATTVGGFVDSRTKLGKQHTEFAAQLLERVSEPVAAPRRGFLRFLLPAAPEAPSTALVLASKRSRVDA